MNFKLFKLNIDCIYKSVLADNQIRYMYTYGNNNTLDIINAVGQNIYCVPGSTINYLLNSGSKNVTIVKTM